MSTETLSRVLCSAVELGEGDAPPTEFRIFRAGLNDTHKGPFLFDDEAARLVMADFQRAGVDLMIDLEHLSLKQESKAYDPDARGHCKLAVRNGELWAVDVKWTADGKQRLSDRRQRYTSPVVERDAETNRVLSIFNVALCGQPATFNAQPLIAASKRLAERGPACKALIALLAKQLSTPKKKKR